MPRKTYPPAPKRSPAKPLEPKSFAPPESKWQWVFFGSFLLVLVMLVIVVAVGCGYHNHDLPACDSSGDKEIRHTHGNGITHPGSDHYRWGHNPDDYCLSSNDNIRAK